MIVYKSNKERFDTIKVIRLFQKYYNLSEYKSIPVSTIELYSKILSENIDEFYSTIKRDGL